MARQNRLRSPEESRDEKRAYSFEASAAEIDWPRMPDERLPKNVFYGELQVGERSQGGQKEHYKDNLKVSLKVFNIPPETREQSTQDQTK